MHIDENLLELCNEFSKLDEVQGILLAGSHATKTNDKNSDYDLYIYSNETISLDKRKVITEKYCGYMELDNKFWETEDDGYLKQDNIPIEIIYRDLEWIKSELDRVLVEFEASVGYTTCFWANFQNSIILYDKNGELKTTQEKYKISFPKKLKENIISKNYPLLKSQMPAYYYQIEKAIKRNDFISVNHRIAAFFTSYFDIIFAVNEMPHPGEKKIMKIIKDNNLRVPDDIEQNVKNILKLAVSEDFKILNELDLLINNLDNLLKKEGLWNEIF